MTNHSNHTSGLNPATGPIHNNDNSNNNYSRTPPPQPSQPRYRKVLPGANEAKGRSIVKILYDRSIHGPNGIGGVRKQSFFKSKLGNDSLRVSGSGTTTFLNSSPSSVIRSGSDDDEDDNNINESNAVLVRGGGGGQVVDNNDNAPNTNHTNSHNGGTNIHVNDDMVDAAEETEQGNDMDSLSEVLNSASTNNASQTNLSRNNRHHLRISTPDSLAEVLNGTLNNGSNADCNMDTDNTNGAVDMDIDNPSTTTSTDPNTSSFSSTSSSKLTMPPRVKMNTYPIRHSTEIRNFVELYTVTKFNWNYLSLKTREELANRRNNRSRRSVVDNHNMGGLASNNNGNHLPHQRNHHQQQQHDNHNNNGHNNDNQNADTDTAISTISIAFSPDGRTVASTHGDHTVKITCCNTGALIRNLEGHPRTPWTVKYHPFKSNIVASGCLGYQVRVWDWNYQSKNNNDEKEEEEENGVYNYEKRRGVCISMIRLKNSIISLSFHPTGIILAVASGHLLSLWVYDDNAKKEYEEKIAIENSTEDENENGDHVMTTTTTPANANSNAMDTRNDTNPIAPDNAAQYDQQQFLQQQQQLQQHLQQQQPNRGNGNTSGTTITQIRYEHNLRCVHFAPGGDTIILGGVNPVNSTPTTSGDTNYSLRLWDFDLEVALNPQKYLGQEGEIVSTQGHGISRRDALTNFRTFISRALLYNDGGFDISPDGKMLCGCAEILLPPGVDSAMELIEKKEEKAWLEEVKQSNIINNKKKTSKKTQDKNMTSGTTISSPKRKSKEEKKRKNMTGSRALEGFGGQDGGAHSPSERPSSNLGGCRTPPNPIRPQILTSPPSPPGRRWSLGLRGRNQRSSGRHNTFQNQMSHNNPDGPPPPPLPPSRYPNHRPANAGRYEPHIVVVSLDKDGKLGQILEAVPLGRRRAASVTCVKFSPSAEFCLLGYGVREHADQHDGEQFHPVTSLYRVRGGLTHVATMLSSDDDVNIARFHPHSGQGFVYGTKQGRVRVLSPRPWSQYYE